MKTLRFLVPLLFVLLAACGGSVDTSPATSDPAPVCGFTLPPAKVVPSLYPCGDEPGATPHDPPLSTHVRETPEGVVVECRCEDVETIESGCVRDLPGRPGLWARVPISRPTPVAWGVLCQEDVPELDGQSILDGFTHDAAADEATPAPEVKKYACTPVDVERIGDELVAKCPDGYGPGGLDWRSIHGRVVFRIAR